MLSVNPLRRSARQFHMEMGLFLFAAIAVAFANHAAFGFPVLQSGGRLAVGIAALGLFSSLDLALGREFHEIVEAQAAGRTQPPQKLSPITRRFTSVAVAVMLVAFVLLALLISRDFYLLAQQGADATRIQGLERSVLLEIGLAMGVLLALSVRVILSYSRNLKLLFANQTEALVRVSSGDLNVSVPVATRDELGFIAGHTNTMIRGLADRMRLKQGVDVAREIQQHLLPSSAPDIPGVDVAGACLYSDETGGDFYDWMPLPQGGWAVLVGDVTGHGVGAAVLMASVRALLRQRLAHAGDPGQVLTEVNRLLCRDTDGTGRFVTLFLLVVRPDGALDWARAGHDPALLFRSATGSFEQLDGEGIPLGVDREWRYETSGRAKPDSGDVLVLGTDGLRESRNVYGELFGWERMRGAVRKVSDSGAEAVRDNLLRAEEIYRGDALREDDVTLVALGWR